MVVGVRDLLDARVYDLGRELHDGIPVFLGRYFRQTLVPNGGERLGDNEVDWTIELVTATMQVGTHLDALCHLRRGDAGHDGWTLRRDTTPEGATRLGIESAPQFVTRGWLVDASGGGHVIGTDALDGIDPAPGDAVFFHTGHGAHWDDPATQAGIRRTFADYWTPTPAAGFASVWDWRTTSSLPSTTSPPTGRSTSST